ncbi:AAA family ATPase [Desulfogranum marinum]|uniref:SF1B family DNA helicase RecD2 n=1 Tax=Desulfogranum marinum TaxID=453220 RepID=UPI0029C916BD|nr:AAA family ATPase [Desulfogranum marinum]
MQHERIQEKLKGVVERITYHNESNGWSVLKVSPFQAYGELVTVTVHQTRVFAGATMAFTGAWTLHPRFGKQFKAAFATELKPATTSAVEKYLGSGLIKGVGPKTAKRIVRHFGENTLEVFENNIEQLVNVPGIAAKKLASIEKAWTEHKAIRDVMMFLQSYGISTLFAVRIYKQYGDEAISIVQKNPYRLAIDFYGIGFFTADKVALALGFAENSHVRIIAAIRHVLSASRDSGDCFLSKKQVTERVNKLLTLELAAVIPEHLDAMEHQGQLRVRRLALGENEELSSCYYAKSIYYDEEYTATRLLAAVATLGESEQRIRQWVERYTQQVQLALSPEQSEAVCSIANQQCSILTGGPGCGKTTTTKAIVALVLAMGKTVMLTAPTGRAAQRMGEVIGQEAKTVHRLLEFQGTGFNKNEDNPLKTDFLIIDECSMLDITLTASLLRAVSKSTAILFIGDADQLPAVGAGNVLKDMINSRIIPCFQLTAIFRQAKQSHIITTAHEINKGRVPRLDSPFKKPEVWRTTDCFFVDSDEATQQQLKFTAKVKQHYHDIDNREAAFDQSPFDIEIDESGTTYGALPVPSPFSHVDLGALATADAGADTLLTLAQKTHPWSSLYYGLTAQDVVQQLYLNWIPKYMGKKTEIQVLSPMIRGSLGTGNLNLVLQKTINPPTENKAELTVGERIFRVGDRVIHRRNNYDLNVFNGDIGKIESVDNTNLKLSVVFYPDSRVVEYNREQITELDLAYAITIHKSQGSEFDAVIIPVLTQHFKMLFRNLLYTGVTRGKELVVLVGTRKALAMAVKNQDTSLRQTALCHLLQSGLSSNFS